MPDPIIPSARYVINEAIQDLRKDAEQVPADALNWKPAGDDTNSIAVLVTHVLSSTRMWVSVAVGAELPDRDRDSEFDITEDDPAALLALIDDVSAQILGLLDRAGDVDWAANRKTHLRPDPSLPNYVPAAWALIHAIEHLGQHVAHTSLTKQMWEAQARNG